MGIQEIVDNIIAEAEEKAKKIIEEYNQKAKLEIEKKEKELKDFEKQEKAKIDKEAELSKQRMIQIQDLEMRKKILEAKQKLLDKVFDIVKERIYKMPTPEYRNFIKNKIIQYVKTGEEEIICGEDDREIINEEFIENICKELKEKLRENVKLKISNEKSNIKKGFILKQGKIRINFSIDSIIKEARQNFEHEIVKILFGK